MNKKCSKCNKLLPVEMFSRAKKEKCGYRSTCKECEKRYYQENRAKIKLRKKQYYLENSDEIKKKVHSYRRENPAKCSDWFQVSKNKLKQEVFSHYCHGDIKCQWCGERELDLLTMDHVNGGGNKHRKEIGRKTGYNFYRWLKNNDYPDEFQVLCWNCNFRKRNQENRPQNPTKRQTQKAEYVRSVKMQILEHYGEVCSCGETDPEVLTLDHVNDDGKEHRDTSGKRGFNFYIWLRQNGFPNDPPLQTLCLNCQYRKRSVKYEEERKMRTSDDCQDAKTVV